MPLGLVVLGLMACSELELSGVTDFENSVAKNSSSSAANDFHVIDQPVKQDLWAFNDFLADSGNTNSGYWFDFVGTEEGNSSTIEFPVQKGGMSSADYMRSIVDACGGYCGTVELRGSSPKPVRAGVGFKLSADGEATDVSAWKGLCVTYRSDLPMRLMLSSGDKANRSDFPFVQFPKMQKKSTLCSEWDDFKREDSIDESREKVLNKVDDILFEFEGHSGESGEFNIKGLASYKNAVGQLSSSSQNVSSSSSFNIIENFAFNDVCSFVSVDNLWYGPSGEVQVQTGLENSTKTQGYWFIFGNDNFGSESEIAWPVPLGNDYTSYAVDSVIQFCGGVCGITSFSKDSLTDQPFVGVGFNVVGEDPDFGNPAAGDVSAWGGLCVTYASETDMNIAIPYDDDNVLSNEDLFEAPLPRSIDVTTKCVKWDEFTSSSNRTFDPTNVVSVRFLWRGDESTQTGFNIMGLGKYQQLSNPECKAEDNYVKNIGYYKNLIKQAESNSSSSLSSSSFSSLSAVNACETFNDLWYGASGASFVNTGVDGLAELRPYYVYQGFWYGVSNYVGYYYDDEFSKQNLYWVDPVSMQVHRSFVVDTTIFERCGGICAVADFDEQGFLGVAFNVVGVYDRNAADGDASAWGGLCVTYASESDMDVVMLDTVMNNIEYAPRKVPLMPKVTLPRSVDATTKCVRWNEFVSTTGEVGDPTHVAAFRFIVSGEDATQAGFNIMGLGRYKQLSESECKVQDNYVKNIGYYKNLIKQAKTNSSSSSFSSSSVVTACETFNDLWYGPSGEVQVQTGLENSTKTQGYWFIFGNDNFGSESEIAWPVPLGNDYTSYAVDSVIQFCGGVCGITSFSKDSLTDQPFVGVGFNVVGEDPDFGNPAAGDVSAWGGLCVTYASETDMSIAILYDEESFWTPEDTFYAFSIEDLFEASLPRSVDVTTKCVKWDEFTSSMNRTFDPTNIVSIRFLWRGDESTQTGFNIMGLGKYKQYSGSECDIQENYVKNIDYYKAQIGR